MPQTVRYAFRMTTTVAPPPAEVIARHAAKALEEDRAREDATGLAMGGEVVSARIVAREDLVVCGLPVAEAVFREMGDVAFQPARADGEWASAGDLLVDLAGPAAAVLAAERTALNFLGRLSGVATETRRFVEAVPRGSDLTVLDTRKTTPGLRDLEKYAVRVGGGANHRRDLAEGIMIKDNHVAVAGGVAAAVRAVRARHGEDVRIVLEADDLDEVVKAVSLGVARVLLDNFSDEAIREALALVGDACEVEVSGGVTVERIPRLAEMGVKFVSVGALTHAARWRDVSLEVLGLR